MSDNTNSNGSVRILIQGRQVVTATPNEGETYGDFLGRVGDENGLPTGRVETFVVNGTPLSMSDPVRPGDFVIGAPKNEGGLR